MRNDLSDNQRRTICRALFLLVCALPTFVTVYFATHQRSADDWAQLLQAELGVETSIGVVETPRPDEIIFHRLQLKDSDGGVIFDSPKARVTLGDVNKIQFQNPIHFKREGLSHLLEEASGRLISMGAEAKSWEVSFATVEVLDGSDVNFENQPLHLETVLVKIDNGLQGRQITVEADKLGSIKFARSSNYGQFVAEVNTFQNAVPCWLASEWYPDLNHVLGDQAQFKGVAVIYSSEASSTSALTGKFDHIDFPHMSEFNSNLVTSSPSISVEDLVLKDRVLHGGNAILELDSLRHIDLKPYFSTPTIRADAPFEIIRQAILEDSSSNVTRW